MARIAATEDVEGIRDEENMYDGPSQLADEDTEKEAGARSHSPEQRTAAHPEARVRKHVATIQEVHEAFDSVNVLRYSQPCHLQGELQNTIDVTPAEPWIAGKCQGLTIIPFNAGHTLGGTIWKIRSPTAGTILYAVDINHMKERHLDGTVIMRSGSNATIFETLVRPDLLITDAERANVTTARRKDRDAALLGT